MAKKATEPEARIIIAMSKSLLDEIDDFRFEHRLKSRADAIRRLLRCGLDRHEPPPPSRKRPK